MTPLQIQDCYKKLQTAKKINGKVIPALSPTSAHNIHAVLNIALKQAVKWRVIGKNPCEAVDPPEKTQI